MSGFQKIYYETKIFYIIKKVKNKFFYILIIFKNLFKYIKSNSFNKKIIFWPKTF